MSDRRRTEVRESRVRSAGDLRETLADVYDAWAKSMYRYALMILADHAAAEDAVQQVFMKLARMGSGMLKIDSYNGYLQQAVRRECYTILRRRQRDRQINPSAAGPLLEPGPGTAVNEDERLDLEEALRTLPPEQREIVHLKVYEQMTFQQIAEVLAISANTAASRYRYAMEKIRRRINLQ